MASRGGDGVSRNVSALFDPATGKCTEVLINGQPVKEDKMYRLSTINYLAAGGDYMSSLKNGRVIASSPNVLYDDMIEYLQNGPLKGKTLKADNTQRMKPQK